MTTPDEFEPPLTPEEIKQGREAFEQIYKETEGYYLQEEQSGTQQCIRCGRLYHPKWLDGIKVWSRCCGPCGMRNLADALFDISDTHETDQTAGN